MAFAHKIRPRRTANDIRKSVARHHVIYDTKVKIKDDHFVILTSTYNKTQYINDWLRSILWQQYRPLHVSLVDDCSNDGAHQIYSGVIRQCEANGISISIIRNTQRLYCADSYRVAHEQAGGQAFYGVLDADDMLMEHSVSSVMNIYKKFPEIAFIYTQFQVCDPQMRPLKKGFCMAPPCGLTLLDLGISQEHGFSHWRTFSHRLTRPLKLWMKGLRCAVDKYMGYRLEEMGNGLFLDDVCYSYRQDIKNCISHSEQTKNNWRRIKIDAMHRRVEDKIKCGIIYTFDQKLGTLINPCK